MTKTQIQNDIKRLEKERIDLKDENKDPKIAELKKQLSDAQNKFYDSVRSKNDALWGKICELKKELRQLEIEKIEKAKKELPEKILTWWEKYRAGFAGSERWKIQWYSATQRFVIYSYSGGITGQGTAMGVMGYRYNPATHTLIDIETSGGMGTMGNHIKRIEGRLTKEKKQELIDCINPYLEKK